MKQLLLNMLRVARIKLVDDSGPVQRLQIDEGDFPDGRRVLDKIAHLKHFGFASSPPAESDVMLTALGGDRSQTIAIGTNHQKSRPLGLGMGDSMLYRARADGALGASVSIKDGVIEIDADGGAVMVRNATTVTVVASEKVRVEAPTLECTGDIVSRADGARVSLNTLRDKYDAHKHPVTALGSPTGTSDSPA
ncbi:phage baseplate assembly protein domain-containing protein [Sphingomonas sp. UYP23]